MSTAIINNYQMTPPPWGGSLKVSLEAQIAARLDKLVKKGVAVLGNRHVFNDLKHATVTYRVDVQATGYNPGPPGPGEWQLVLYALS
jgi:hypothetical protein